jgi:predicted dehydrogenase
MKAALLGIEHPHSLAHLSTLQQLPEVKQILLWDENEQALHEALETRGEKVEKVYTDVETLLADPDLFFVIAALRNDISPDIFIRALEAGKHVMAEKPIGRAATDTARVVATAERAGLKLGVCYQNRWLPLIRDMRAFVRQGLVGPLMSVEIRLLTTQVQFRNPKLWLFSKAQAGGGILSWLGCHYIDLMRYVTGDEIVSVSAQVATRSGEDIDVEDVAALALRFRSGAVGSLHAGYTLAMSGSGYFNKSGYDIYVGLNGRAGRLHWSTSGKPTQLYVETTHPDWAAAPRREFTYELADSPAYGGVAGEEFIRDFIRAARGDGPLPASGQDALQVARVVDAAYESSRTGRQVDIEAP